MDSIAAPRNRPGDDFGLQNRISFYLCSWAMSNRAPILPEQRPPLPPFDPVPRRLRHDGWTAERQRAFIEALADTGSPRTAAQMVNMAATTAYALRRSPGAESFRRAWDAALDLALELMKAEAFERALHGTLVPVFVGGKLTGYRRQKSDRMLMFCLRHYGQDADGRRVTVNYFSTKASAGAAGAAGGGGGGGKAGGEAGAGEGAGTGAGAGAAAAQAEATATTIRTTVSGAGRGGDGGRAEALDRSAALVCGFEPAELDEAARGEIRRALEACAERRRVALAEDDPQEAYVGLADASALHLGVLELPGDCEDFEPFREGEERWEGMGVGGDHDEIEQAIAAVEAHRALPAAERAAREAEWDREEERARAEAAAGRSHWLWAGDGGGAQGANGGDGAGGAEGADHGGGADGGEAMDPEEVRRIEREFAELLRQARLEGGSGDGAPWGEGPLDWLVDPSLDAATEAARGRIVAAVAAARGGGAGGHEAGGDGAGGDGAGGDGAGGEGEHSGGEGGGGGNRAARRAAAKRAAKAKRRPRRSERGERGGEPGPGPAAGSGR
jgi:hypothetical protein